MINYRGLDIPCEPLGACVTTDNLFDPNEQIIFDFYEANRGRYRRALDIGANVGVHSILMARCGWQVRAFEPDPQHFFMLLRNCGKHDAYGVTTVRAAVSDQAGTVEFVRVLNNTTGSHLLGAKRSYGPVERIAVAAVDCRPHFAWADFAKIDCEGHEAALVCATTGYTWRNMDAMMEVGSEANAEKIFRHLFNIVPMWAQRLGWERVRWLEDMPIHHSQGSLFVGRDPPFAPRGGRSG